MIKVVKMMMLRMMQTLNSMDCSTVSIYKFIHTNIRITTAIMQLESARNQVGVLYVLWCSTTK